MHGRTKDGRNQEWETEGIKTPKAPRRKVYKLHSVECPNRPSLDADQGRGDSNISKKIEE